MCVWGGGVTRCNDNVYRYGSAFWQLIQVCFYICHLRVWPFCYVVPLPSLGVKRLFTTYSIDENFDSDNSFFRELLLCKKIKKKNSQEDASSITTILTSSSLGPTVIGPIYPHNMHLLLIPLTSIHLITLYIEWLLSLELFF